MRNDGAVYAWGDVSNGKLGTVISSDVYTPAQVWRGESDTDVWYLGNVIRFLPEVNILLL